MKLTGNGKAAAYQQLLDNFGMTHEELARRTGAGWGAQHAAGRGRDWTSLTSTITEANLDSFGETLVSDSGLPLAMAVSQ